MGYCDVDRRRSRPRRCALAKDAAATGRDARHRADRQRGGAVPDASRARPRPGGGHRPDLGARSAQRLRSRRLSVWPRQWSCARAIRTATSSEPCASMARHVERDARLPGRRRHRLRIRQQHPRPRARRRARRAPSRSKASCRCSSGRALPIGRGSVPLGLPLRRPGGPRGHRRGGARRVPRRRAAQDMDGDGARARADPGPAGALVLARPRRARPARASSSTDSSARASSRGRSPCRAIISTPARSRSRPARPRGCGTAATPIADWPLLNALLNAVNGADLVTIHQGAGSGMGGSISAGMTVIADGSDSADGAHRPLPLHRPGDRRRPPRRRRLRGGQGRRGAPGDRPAARGIGDRR